MCCDTCSSRGEKEEGKLLFEGMVAVEEGRRREAERKVCCFRYSETRGREIS